MVSVVTVVPLVALRKQDKACEYAKILRVRLQFTARKFGKFMGGGKFVGTNADNYRGIIHIFVTN